MFHFGTENVTLFIFNSSITINYCNCNLEYNSVNHVFVDKDQFWYPFVPFYLAYYAASLKILFFCIILFLKGFRRCLPTIWWIGKCKWKHVLRQVRTINILAKNYSDNYQLTMTLMLPRSVISEMHFCSYAYSKYIYMYNEKQDVVSIVGWEPFFEGTTGVNPLIVT